MTDVEEGGETGFPGGRWLDEAAQKQPPYTGAPAPLASLLLWMA